MRRPTSSKVGPFKVLCLCSKCVDAIIRSRSRKPRAVLWGKGCGRIERCFGGGFLGRNLPFLDPSYDPS